MIADVATSIRRAPRVSVAVAGAALALALWWAVPSGPIPAEAKGNSSQAAAAKSRGGSPTLYWGAWIGTGLTGEAAPWDMGAVSAFQQMVRKPLSLVEWSSPFANCESSPCSFFGFPSQEMGNVRQYGAIPFLSWGSQSIPVDEGQPGNLPDYQLSDVIAGRYDSYIRSFAAAAKSWGHPFFLRFNHEMNGDWFPWGIKTNGNRPRQFVPAWRHVHRIFTAVGATNATWVWCPYVDIGNDYNLRALYPGNRFVDWTCLDGYNWGPQNPANPRPWRSFEKIFRSTYRRVITKIAPRKPMILAELATSDYGGNKAAWIRNMLATLPKNYPRVRAFIYFDVNDRNSHWEIESSPAVISAFRNGIQRPAYLRNRYGGITRSPIPPPARR
jgi:hypothetical protein